MKKVSITIDEIIHKIKIGGEFVYKYRFCIAALLFILCLLLQISGSSIGAWGSFINSNVPPDNGVIIGKSREIRTDEWAVLTPMMFSQKFDGFNYFSSLLRASKTDVFMVYALPVFNLMQIFRPFQLGFLILGNSGGLSFFWCGRFIALFLVSFELMMILTKKKKLLSFTGAVMVTLAPIVQWWFAVNGIAEIFIFGELAIILLYKYMNDNNLQKRCLYLLGLVICAGGYILTFYPAWQIPMVYVFLALAIWVIIDNRKKFKINYKDIISILVAIILFSTCMGYILHNSLDTIKAVMGTVYPGSRALTGGGDWKRFFEYAIDIFLPKKDIYLNSNQCEEALMFGLFPVGIILSIINLIKTKKKDALLVCLLIAYTFLGFYCIIGFPKIIATVTLMSKVQPGRAILAIGFLDVLLLMRNLYIMDEPLKRKNAILISLILTVILVFICKITHRMYLTKMMLAAMIIMCSYLFYFLFRYKAKYANYLFTIGITFVMIMAGGTVNPIRKGIDVIYESDIIKEVQVINHEENGKWIVEELDFPKMNYLFTSGVQVINGTNTYPELNRWRKIDTEDKYEDVYNRYAHIRVKIEKEPKDVKEKFVLTFADAYTVYLIPNELKTLEVKYIFTTNDLEKFTTNEVQFQKKWSNEIYKIYKVNY